MNNVVRHSGASRLDVELRVERGWLSLRVADDGVGAPGASDSSGHGLRSMRERAQRLKGTLDIRLAEPSGTTVALRVPLDRRFGRFDRRVPT